MNHSTNVRATGSASRSALALAAAPSPASAREIASRNNDRSPDEPSAAPGLGMLPVTWAWDRAG